MFVDYMRRAIARVFTVASVIDLFSSSLHERSLRRLAVAHDLVSPGEHSSCRDWFECLLRTKASLSSRECCSEGELNYFNGTSATSLLKVCVVNTVFTGWWGKDLVFSVSSPSAIHWPSSAMHTLYSGNCLAQRVGMRMYVCAPIPRTLCVLYYYYYTCKHRDTFIWLLVDTGSVYCRVMASHSLLLQRLPTLLCSFRKSTMLMLNWRQGVCCSRYVFMLIL